MASFRRLRWLKWMRRTPLHPQWLLGNQGSNIAWIQTYARGRVLDVGCADCWVAPHIAGHCEYISLDYPATGRDMYGASPGIFGDAAKLPFSDETIDTILLLEVLEHLRHPEQALLEAARVLKPGGQLLLTIPFLYPVHDAPHDYQRYTSHGLTREIELAGLDVEHMEPSLGTAESGGLVFALALGGMANEALAQKRLSVLLLPILVLAIVGANLFSWLLERILPRWPALTAGYRLRAIRR